MNGTGANKVNESSFEWSINNYPLFDSSDDDLVKAYYYRAKAYKSHLIQTDWVDIKHVVSEFTSAVPWGHPYGAINAAAGHHINEGRWLRDPSYVNGLIRFWLGSLVAGDAVDAARGHFANGTVGDYASCPYSSWIITAAVRSASTHGDWLLGLSFNGSKVTFKDLLPGMIDFWERRTLQLRVDCIINGASCLDAPPTLESHPHPTSGLPASAPYCYIIQDGWDAMEGSVSGHGCRPTIGAMMYSEALAISTVANATGEITMAEKFVQRAGWIREWYLKYLWNSDLDWLTVYKEGVEFTGEGGCTMATKKHEVDVECCCVSGTPDPNGPYKDFMSCPTNPPFEPQSPGNYTQCSAQAQLRSPDGKRGSSSWECGKPVAVRELLGLGPPYYFGIIPSSDEQDPVGDASRYDQMWPLLFNQDSGFWAKFGPTTTARGHTCFNKSRDMGECQWSAPSWPYETSRVLTGLSNFISNYPKARTDRVGMNNQNFTTLLQTYARSMTTGNATNGSSPWVGENIEPDKGYWIARSIMYKGGHIDDQGNPTGSPVNCSACKGRCYDRDWSHDGAKCTAMDPSSTLGPCDQGCKCVPPSSSFPPPPCCGAKESCDGKIIPTPDKDRGKDYMHSTFIDIIIEGLVGLRSDFSTKLTVNPLADPAELKFFALDNVFYHGHNVSVLYDPQGNKWPEAGCLGFCVFIDQVKKATSPSLSKLVLDL